jgi:hypothetical protein
MAPWRLHREVAVSIFTGQLLMLDSVISSRAETVNRRSGSAMPEFVPVTQVEGDKIRSEQIYFDRQVLFEQLGLKAK